jgi:hypothetical protein
MLYAVKIDGEFLEYQGKIILVCREVAELLAEDLFGEAVNYNDFSYMI